MQLSDQTKKLRLVPIEPAHVAEVHRIFCESFTSPWSREALDAECHRPDGITLVALYEGEVAGFLNAEMVLDEANLQNIAVREKNKRQGIATALLRQFFKKAAGQGVRTVYLEVRITNVAARQLYLRHGFTPIGRRKNFYTQPAEDALLFSCSLSL